MNKNFLFLIPLLLVSIFGVLIADAVPDIRGEYSGQYWTVLSNCTDSSTHGTYGAVLEMNISIQTENTFSGTATGTFIHDQAAKEYIQFSGTITESGKIRGNTSHTFSGTRGEGTFTGQLSGHTLTIENPGKDTYGETCSYTRSMSAIREPSESIIVPPTLGQGSGVFGSTVSISGDYAIVGSPADNTIGAALVFERSGSSWNQVSKLTPSDAATSDSFGISVSISGDYAIVGRGKLAAYIFERNGSNWTEVAKLVPGNGDIYYDMFGSSVSISGGYAIVGAANNDESGKNAGAAYVFERSEGVWQEVAKLTASDAFPDDAFGTSVSISGGCAIIGALRNDEKGGDSGSAYIFERGDSGWTQAAKLTASDGVAYDLFGHSVSISGDSAIVGADTNVAYGTGLGSAYLFERSGSSWTETAKLTNGDGAAGDMFGSKVSISGGRAIVGAWGNNGSEAAYLFEQSGSNWTVTNRLTASDRAPYGSFGYSVSISGLFAIVGSEGRDNTIDYGRAYVYDLSIPPDIGAVLEILQPPQSCTAAPGSTATFTVLTGGIAGESYGWKHGDTVVGGDSATLTLSNIQASDAGQYTVSVTAGGETVSSRSVTLGVKAPPYDTEKMMNISTRGQILEGFKVMIAGFVLDGSGQKDVLIRGIGPTLGQWVTGVCGDPKLTLFRNTSPATPSIAENEVWGSLTEDISSITQRVGGFPLTNGSKDAVLYMNLYPGAYTAKVFGMNGTGVGLVELYDADLDPLVSTCDLSNISTRGEVGTKAQILIAGFVVAGEVPKQVLVRGIGPRLADFDVDGTLVDPYLRILKNATPEALWVATNDNWSDNPNAADIVSTSASVGAFDLVDGSKDAVMLTWLEPGTYTVQVSGVDDGTGVALVEVYEVK